MNNRENNPVERAVLGVTHFVWVLNAIILLVILMVITSTPARGQGYYGQDDRSALVYNLQVMDDLKRKDPRWEQALQAGSDAFAGIMATAPIGSTCRNLTYKMQAGEFGRRSEWFAVVRQLQRNMVHGRGWLAGESRDILANLSLQVDRWDNRLSSGERLRSFFAPPPRALNDVDLPAVVAGYFTTGTTDVCRVANPRSQLRLFGRIQRVLAATDGKLAARTLRALAPAVLYE